MAAASPPAPAAASISRRVLSMASSPPRPRRIAFATILPMWPAWRDGVSPLAGATALTRCGAFRPRLRHGGVELRRLAAFEHAVIANDAHVPLTQRFGPGGLARNPHPGGIRVAPRGEHGELAGRVDAGEHLAIDQAIGGESEIAGKTIRVHVTAIRVGHDIRDGDDLGGADFGFV